jgi:hypothetical protein
MFPKEMKEFYLKTSLYGLRCFSSLYLVWDQVYNGYKAFIMDHESEAEPIILCIKNGQIMSKLTGSDAQLLPVCFDYYDLVLYKERVNNNNNDNNKYKYQVTRLEKDSCLANLPPPSTVNLVDITVFTNSQRYTLDFGSTNFYVEGNILCDQKFLQWYLRTFLKVELLEPYMCTIVDADINCITLYVNSHIIIQKEGFDIVNVGVSANETGLDKVNIT